MSLPKMSINGFAGVWVATAVTLGAAPAATKQAQANEPAAASENATLPRTIVPSKGTFKTYDIRHETNALFIKDAPFAASRGRISVILYGDSIKIRDAVGFAGKVFAKNIHDVSFLWAKDNDVDPVDVQVAVYGNGRRYGHHDIGVDVDQQRVAKAVFKMMKEAYAAHVKPRLIIPSVAPDSRQTSGN